MFTYNESTENSTSQKQQGPIVQWPRTPAFQAGYAGSNPAGTAIELKYLANTRDISIVTPLIEPHQQGLGLDLQPSYQ